MDRDFFLNAGLHFEPSSQVPSWKMMASAPEMNFPPAQSTVDRFNNLESTLNSMVSSPVSNLVASKDTFAVRELIGKLGSICNGGGEVSPAAMAPVVADPGFAERAAKFSSFGSHSFNGRNNQSGLNSNNPDSQFRSSVSPLIGNEKMPRVYSSPSLKIDGSRENNNSIGTHMVNGSDRDRKSNSNGESSVSEQLEIGLRNPSDLSSRKRKAASSKGKAKELASAFVKEEGNDDSNSKKQKKTEDDTTCETEKKKLPEPPNDYKDYIHVRARRGQATDSHSLAERVRREKISERMKLLQDLVPGCNKVTGKAIMLDEIINYVQSLQHQVEFLSMKLATVNPRQDFDMNSQLCKENMNQSYGNLSQQLYTMETSTSEFYHQNQQVLFSGSTANAITQSPVDPLPLVHGFTENFSHFAGFEADDLHNIFKMGYTDNHDHDQTSEMKIEL